MSKLQQRALARFICDKFDLTADAASTDNDFLACQAGLYECQSDLRYDGSLTRFMTAKQTDDYLWSIYSGLEEAEERIKKWRIELDRFHNSFYDNPSEFAKLVATLPVEE